MMTLSCARAIASYFRADKMWKSEVRGNKKGIMVAPNQHRGGAIMNVGVGTGARKEAEPQQEERRKGVLEVLKGCTGISRLWTTQE